MRRASPRLAMYGNFRYQLIVGANNVTGPGSQNAIVMGSGPGNHNPAIRMNNTASQRGYVGFVNIWDYGISTKAAGGHAANLVLRTEGVTRVFVSRTGEVGIGTTRPSTTLHVSGTTLTSSWTGINFAEHLGRATPTAPLEVIGMISSTGLTATGIVTATYFEGDGSRLTNLPGGGGGTQDRIVSGTTSIIANDDTSITFTVAGKQQILLGDTGYGNIGTMSGTMFVSGSGEYWGMLAAGRRFSDQDSEPMWELENPSGSTSRMYLRPASAGGTHDYDMFLEHAFQYSRLIFGDFQNYFSLGKNNREILLLALKEHVAYGVPAVGIGFTTDPSRTLHVSGTADFTSWTAIALNTTPAAPLDVYGTISSTGLAATGIVTATYFEGDGSRLSNVPSGGTPDRIVSGSTNIIANEDDEITFAVYATLGQIGMYSHSPLNIITSNTSRIYIAADGNIGMGGAAADPIHRLLLQIAEDNSGTGVTINSPAAGRVVLLPSAAAGNMNNLVENGDTVLGFTSGTTTAGGSLSFIGGIKAAGIVTATYFEGDGSRLTGISGGGSTDRLISGSSVAYLNPSGILHLTTSGGSVGIGPGVGTTSLGSFAIGIGYNGMQNNTGSNAIGIGSFAGGGNAGADAVMMGSLAGYSNTGIDAALCSKSTRAILADLRRDS